MSSVPDTTSCYVGDPVLVSDAEGQYYGVIIGIVSKDTLCVQMIKQQANKCYAVTSDAYHVPYHAIEQHESLHGDDSNAPAAYDRLGFRMLDGSTFVKHSDETGNAMFPVGDAAFDLCSDDGSSSMGSLKDFIVDDDKCEPFTVAPDDSSFVRETHAAVHGFNDWVPVNDREYSMRRFIQQQEARAVAIDDNVRFAQADAGACPNYTNPGT